MIEKETTELENQLTQADDIDAVLDNNSSNIPIMDLSQYLDYLLEIHNLSKAKVIAESNIERTYCYHIFDGTKNPNRLKVLALALAMKLDIKEVQRLLYYAHHEKLYVKNEWDKIIFFAINKKLSVTSTNIILSDLGMTPLLG